MGINNKLRQTTEYWFFSCPVSKLCDTFKLQNFVFSCLILFLYGPSLESFSMSSMVFSHSPRHLATLIHSFPKSLQNVYRANGSSCLLMFCEIAFFTFSVLFSSFHSSIVQLYLQTNKVLIGPGFVLHSGTFKSNTKSRSFRHLSLIIRCRHGIHIT